MCTMRRKPKRELEVKRKTLNPEKSTSTHFVELRGAYQSCLASKALA